MISLEKSMSKDMARFFRHQGNVLLEYLPEEFDDSDFSRAWDRTQLETYLEFRDLLLKHKRRAAYTCLRALENELSVPMQEAAKPRTIGTKISFDDFDEEAYKHIEQYAGARISQIDDTTKKDIREIIAKGFKGELQPDGTTKYKTHQQIAKDIKDKFKEFGDPVKGPSHIRNRAHLVAVTELREAGETSKQLARNRMEERGWQMLKRWMNMGDDRVSDGCIENGNAGWIDNKEAFPSGHQFPPRFPGCRCGCGSRVGDRKEKSSLPDDRWIVTRQGDKVVVKPNPKYANGYDKPLPDNVLTQSAGTINSLSEAQTIEDLHDWYKQNYTDFKFDVSGADFKLAKQVAIEVDKFATEYEHIVRPHFKEVSIVDSSVMNGAYAHAYRDGSKIGLSSHYYSSYDLLSECLAKDVAAGWHPEGITDPASIVVHEIGHIVHASMRRTGGSFTGHIDYTSDYGAVYSASSTLDSIKGSKKISEYSLKNDEEKFAESFVINRYHPKTNAYNHKYVKVQRNILNGLITYKDNVGKIPVRISQTNKYPGIRQDKKSFDEIMDLFRKWGLIT